nr:MAG TPA: hypothetical protein [Microviridae sp.]
MNCVIAEKLITLDSALFRYLSGFYICNPSV